MSKRSKPVRRGNPATSNASSPPKRSTSAASFIAATLVAVVAASIWWWRTRPGATPPLDSPAAESQTTNTPPPAAAPAGAVARPEFQRLIGKWQRPDGGYVIEIKGVDADGKLDTSYFNPKPIHVARAQAAVDGTALKVFIELRDVNYPGSTYTLGYVPGSDTFTGIYYQALQQQSFEVNFVRMK